MKISVDAIAVRMYNRASTPLESETTARDNELEKRKAAAYEHGQNLGYVNAKLPSADKAGYDPRSEEWDAFRDGYEDGRLYFINNNLSGA